MEPEGSSPYSQVPAIYPYPEPTPSSLHPSHFPKIHLNIILPSTPGSPQCSLSLRFPYQNPVLTSLLPHTRHMPHPSHSSRFFPYALHHIILWGNLSTILLYVMLSTWCERCYLLAVVLPLRDSLQGWVRGSSYCFIHLRSYLSLLKVLVRSLYFIFYNNLTACVSNLRHMQ